MYQAIQEETVYEFDELSDAGQDKAIENLSDVNVFEWWWEDEYEYIRDEWSRKYGIEVDVKEFSFDLGRDWYFWPGCRQMWVSDHRTLYRALGMSHGEKLAVTRGDLAFSFQDHLYMGCRGRTELCIDDYRSSDAPDLTIDPDQWFSELCQDALKLLSDEYEYMISREAIIEANQYNFTADGRLA